MTDEHPLRKLARELRDFGQKNPYWSQVYDQFTALIMYCELTAGYNEGIQREAKMHLLLESIKGVLSNVQLDDGAKIVRIKTLIDNAK